MSLWWYLRYVGEYVSDHQAERRPEDSYLFDLDNSVRTALFTLFVPTQLLFTNWKLRLKFFGSYVGAGHVLSRRVALRQRGPLHKPLVRAESRAGPRVRRASGPALPAHCALRLPRHRCTRRARVWRYSIFVVICTRWIYSIFTYEYIWRSSYIFFAGSTTEKSIGWWRVSAYSFANAVLLVVAIVFPLHLLLHVIPIPIEFINLAFNFLIIFK